MSENEEWEPWMDMEEIHDGPSGTLIAAVFVLGLFVLTMAFVLVAQLP